jgi:hypothetical protein
MSTVPLLKWNAHGERGNPRTARLNVDHGEPGMEVSGVSAGCPAMRSPAIAKRRASPSNRAVGSLRPIDNTGIAVQALLPTS